MSFQLTYSSMYDPPEELHARFDRALAELRAAGPATHAMYIDGEMCPAAQTYEKRSPADNRVILGHFPVGTAPDVERAVRAAKQASAAWARTPVTERRRMAAGAPPRPCIAEMGGKNACVVTANADLDRAATGILRSAFGLSGQKCSALSRVYVEESAADQLLAMLTERTRSITVGDPAARANWPGYQPFGGWKGWGSIGKAIGSAYYLPLYLREQSQTIVD